MLAQAEELHSVHAALDHLWQAVDQVLAQPPDANWCNQFATAVAEISANIICHAYADAATPGRMQLWLRSYSDRVEARFTDQGSAFPSPSTLATATGPKAADLPESGMGLALALATVDELSYARTPAGENRWRLLKWLG